MNREALLIVGGVLIGAATGAVVGCLIAGGALLIVHALRKPSP